MRGSGKKEYTVFEILSNILFVSKYLFHINHRLVAVHIPLMIVRVVQPLMSIYFLRVILNELTGAKQVGEVIKYVILLSVSNLFIAVLGSYLNAYSQSHRQKTLHDINLSLGMSVARMPFADIEQPRIKDFIALAASSNSFGDILDHFSNAVLSIVNIILYTSIILYVQPLLLLVMIGNIALQIVIARVRRKHEVAWRQERSPIFRKLGYFSDLLADLRYGKEIRTNRLQSYFLDKEEEQFETAFMPTAKTMARENNWLVFFNSLLNVVQTLFFYILLGYEVVFNGMPIGDFSMYLSSTKQLSDGIARVVDAMSQLMTCGAFARECRYCLEYLEQNSIQRDTKPLNPMRIPTIEFVNVGFRYPDSENYALKNINLTIRQGEKLSIVGVNGAGKSTLVKLLCRFYQPTEGDILVDGVNINTFSDEEYAKCLGAVFQDYQLFSFSVRENITMNQVLNSTRLMQCIAESGLSDEIGALEHGLETSITKEFDEEGVELSGGNAQKVAIARALYKDAPLIILDEPTAALDPIAEYEIYQHFHNMITNKTAVIITHRLAAAKLSDKIAVFSEGKMAEYGTHDELYAKGGIYTDMYDKQAQFYQSI